MVESKVNKVGDMVIWLISQDNKSTTLVMLLYWKAS